LYPLWSHISPVQKTQSLINGNGLLGLACINVEKVLLEVTTRLSAIN
jgi:hypothetical protein